MNIPDSIKMGGQTSLDYKTQCAIMYGFKELKDKLTPCSHLHTVSVFEKNVQSDILVRCCDCGRGRNRNKEWVEI